ncbi:MAG: C25 family cysteine peptidase [Anaerolineales bacterium]|jgi:hypothetical protein|nr:C25 family cysteine peptidase [Anaerolineales bacterium]
MFGNYRLLAQAHLGRIVFFLLFLGLLPGLQACQSPAAPPASNDGIKAAAPLKILIHQDGIYQVPLSELARQGVEIRSATQEQFELLVQDQSVPFWVDDQAGRLVFYGQEIFNRYSQETIYWLLAKDDGSRVFQPVAGQDAGFEQSGGGALPGAGFFFTLHLEENSLYTPLIEDRDPWYWQKFTAPQASEIEFGLKSLATGPGKLRFMAVGLTDSPGSPDHRLDLSLNGKALQKSSWDGQGRWLIETDLPPGTLIDGVNRLEINLPGEPGALVDIVYLDWFEVIYPLSLSAREDRLSFTSSGGLARYEGFSGAVEIFDVTDPMAPTRLEESGDPHSRQGSFETLEGHTYWLVGPAGAFEPARIEPAVLTPDLTGAQNAADYLAVGPPELLEPLGPILSLRQTQGLQTLAVPLQAIYDQFNAGLPEPQAIQALLRYARQNWATSPRFLLLVGDASYDPRGYLAAPEVNRTPAFLIQTQFSGETASDYPFSVLPSEQPIEETDASFLRPQIATGRIPAQRPGQVQSYVAKLLAYEQARQAGTQPANHVLAIADGTDPAFRVDAQTFLGELPASIQSDLLVSKPGESGFNQQVKSSLDQGNWLVYYFGHGSLQMWGKDALFSVQDVPGLRKQVNLPVVVNLTCLTGLFTHPRQESLAEAFLFEPEAGAVAILAPTSLTLPEDQSYLSYGIAEALLDHPSARMGEAVLFAQNKILNEKPEAQDVLRTFLLFGDPALVIQRPPVP